MTYSYFVAELQCSTCHRSTRANINTSIEAEPGTVHEVGTPVDVTMVDMELSHHRTRAPRGVEPLRVLEQWTCPNCGSGNWVEVVIDGGKVVAIDVVEFDQSTLDRVHFVTDWLVEFYRDTVGEPIYVDNSLRKDWPERLRPHLRPSSPA
jgi:hypothetical protein